MGFPLEFYTRPFSKHVEKDREEHVAHTEWHHGKVSEIIQETLPIYFYSVVFCWSCHSRVSCHWDWILLASGNRRFLSNPDSRGMKWSYIVAREKHATIYDVWPLPNRLTVRRSEECPNKQICNMYSDLTGSSCLLTSPYIRLLPFFYFFRKFPLFSLSL